MIYEVACEQAQREALELTAGEIWVIQEDDLYAGYGTVAPQFQGDGLRPGERLVTVYPGQQR